MFIMVLSTALSIMFRYWGADHINLIAWKVNCNPDDPGSSSGNWDPTGLMPEQKEYFASCKGNAAVYRISLMTAFFFFIMAAGSAVSKAAHVGFWAPKMLLYTALITMGFFLPNYVFDDSGYAWLSRVASFLFLLVQITILVDFGYKWNDSWVAKATEEEATGHAGNCPGCCGGWCGNGSRYFGGILGACACFYTFFIVGISLMFKYYTCGISQAFIAITLVLCVIMTIAQLATPDTGALLPSAVITAYCTYLCWSAVANNPDPQCFPDSGVGSHNDNPGLMFAGIVMTGVSLAWTCDSAADAIPGLFAAEESDDAAMNYNTMSDSNSGAITNPTSTTDKPAEDGVEVQLENGSDLEGQQNTVAVPKDGGDDASNEAAENKAAQHIWVFHLIMMIGAVYMAMLLTNWGSDQNQSGTISDGSSPTKVHCALLSCTARIHSSHPPL
jgi:hypothetical protein